MGSETAGDAFTYDCLVFEVSEVLSGEAPADSVPVEFVGDVNPEAFPSEESIAFLLDKGGEEAGAFRTVNSHGLFTSTAHAAVDQPLRPDGVDPAQLATDGYDADGDWPSFVADLREQLG